MYQRALTEEQFADLWEGMQVTGRADIGLMSSWTGTHPGTGALTIITDGMSGRALVLSTMPVPEWVISGGCGAESTR